MQAKLTAGLLAVATLVAIPTAYYRGFLDGRFQAALEENKIAATALRAPDLSLSPDFREFLKGRIYYNIATKYPDRRGYLLRQDWDFGRVALAGLPRKLYAKDPTAASDSFDDAVRNLRHPEP